LEAGIAHWDGELLTIQVSGQWVHEERRLTALALGLPMEAVRIICPATGGAFGGREDISIQIYLGLVALKHPGKTIAMRYSREEFMRARHKRHAIRIHYTLGAKRDGTITAAKITVYSDEGAYASTGPAVLRKAASHSTGPLRVPNVYVDVYGVFTNNNPTGAMRGFGACQMAIAYNGMMDRLAERLELDRIELWRKNLIHSGDEVTTGQRIPISTATECMDAALQQYKLNAGRDAPLAPHQRRGWGLSVICFGLGYGDGFPDATATVNSPKRAAEVYTGGVSMGRLLNMAQIAAEELGVPVNQVDVVWADTDGHPNRARHRRRAGFFTGGAVKRTTNVLDIAAKVLKIILMNWSCRAARPSDGSTKSWRFPSPTSLPPVASEVIRSRPPASSNHEPYAKTSKPANRRDRSLPTCLVHTSPRCSSISKRAKSASSGSLPVTMWARRSIRNLSPVRWLAAQRRGSAWP
jgi:CO/xanthine dehydrogenase Mo-binding subunit